MSSWCVIVSVIPGDPPSVDFVLDDNGRAAVFTLEQAETYALNSPYFAINHVVPIDDIEGY
jgi:hypothetical protein